MKPLLMRKRLGYTLIEIMVALSVFAILATLTSGVMYHVFDTRKRVAKQAHQLDELQLVMSLLNHDMVQFIPRMVRSNDSHVFPAFIGANQYLEFTRGGLVNPGYAAQRSTLARVAYRCDEHQLVRRTWLSLDSPQRNQYEDKILLRHLNACHFSYMSRYHEILPEWRGYRIANNQRVQAIPSAVRLTITPLGWGEMTWMFVLSEGLYGA